MPSCPVCETEAENVPTPGAGDQRDVDCPQCGLFSITGHAVDALPRPRNNRMKAVLGYALRQKQLSERRPVLKQEEALQLIELDFLPDPFEQANNFLLWLGEQQQTPGQTINVRYQDIRTVIGAMSPSDVDFVVVHLDSKGLIETSGRDSTAYVHARLSFDGWKTRAELLAGKVASRRAFMAMQFDDRLSEPLSRWREAVAATGFELFKLNDEPKAGSITNRMRVEIRKSRFVLADQTYKNPGAYWEAGFAEGLGKPVVYLCERGYWEDPEGGAHFDTKQQQTVIYDLGDLDSAVEELEASIRATLPGEAKMEE